MELFFFMPWILGKEKSMICQYCGSEFEAKSKKQKYCSAECGHAARKTGRTVYEKTCLYCGTSFQTINPKQKYCTSACAARHAGDQRKGTYFCEYCGKPRWSDHPNRNRFCSRECANKAKHLETLKRQEQKQRQREADMTRLCDNCGKSFVAKHKGQRFCNRSCQYEDALRKHHEKKEERFVPLIRICPHVASHLQLRCKLRTSSIVPSSAEPGMQKSATRSNGKNRCSRPLWSRLGSRQRTAPTKVDAPSVACQCHRQQRHPISGQQR